MTPSAGAWCCRTKLDNLAANDPAAAPIAIRAHFAYWDDIALVKSGVTRRIVSSGHGFCGIGRKQMRLLLQDRARALGVNLVFQTEIARPRIWPALTIWSLPAVG